MPFFYKMVVKKWLYLHNREPDLFYRKRDMNPIKRVWNFYYEGFSQMTVGKYLWLLIFIKLFIMFFILKLFFFKSELSKFDTPEQKGQVVIENLLNN